MARRATRGLRRARRSSNRQAAAHRRYAAATSPAERVAAGYLYVTSLLALAGGTGPADVVDRTSRNLMAAADALCEKRRGSGGTKPLRFTAAYNNAADPAAALAVAYRYLRLAAAGPGAAVEGADRLLDHLAQTLMTAGNSLVDRIHHPRKKEAA